LEKAEEIHTACQAVGKPINTRGAQITSGKYATGFHIHVAYPKK
jgi:hypothetical protein